MKSISSNDPTRNSVPAGQYAAVVSHLWLDETATNRAPFVGITFLIDDGDGSRSVDGRLYLTPAKMADSHGTMRESLGWRGESLIDDIEAVEAGAREARDVFPRVVAVVLETVRGRVRVSWINPLRNEPPAVSAEARSELRERLRSLEQAGK